MPNKRDIKPIQGERISFVGGKYAGKSGWMNAARGKDESPINYFVIVQLEGKLFVTHVLKENVRPLKKDETYEEQVARQPSVAKPMVAMARAVASYGLENFDGLLDIIKGEMEKAKKKQQALGGEAKYKKVVVTRIYKELEDTRTSLQDTRAALEEAKKSVGGGNNEQLMLERRQREQERVQEREREAAQSKLLLESKAEIKKLVAQVAYMKAFNSKSNTNLDAASEPNAKAAESVNVVEGSDSSMSITPAICWDDGIALEEIDY